MSEIQPSANPSTDTSSLFAPTPQRGSAPIAAWVIAGLVVLAVVAGLIFAGRKRAIAPFNQIQPLASYASMLSLSQLAMSESTSLSGGKSTYIDGHVHNVGIQTVTAITAAVDEISFFEPIRLGDIVIFKSSVNRCVRKAGPLAPAGRLKEAGQQLRKVRFKVI